MIIGAQKGGSTLLARAAAEHPEVWIAKDEVPVFRDPVFSLDALANFSRTVPDDARQRGIKCPDYLGRPEVAPRLVQLEASPKLVVCLRDPVSRAVSTYFWHVRWGLLPIEDPAVGLAKVLDGVYRDRDPRSEEVLSWSLYAAHLERWLEYFSRDRIHIMFSEDLASRPQRVFADMFTYLGVDPAFRPALGQRRVNEGVYSKARLQLLSLRNRYILKWSDDRSYANIGPAQGAFPALVSKSIAAVDRYLLAPIVSNEKPTIPVELECRLRDYFRPDIKRLEQLVGRDLGSWLA